MDLIDNAHDGDTIWFQNGNYNVHDTIQIYSSLRLIAQNPGGAVLRAVDNIESIIKVKSPEVTISGFTLDGNHRSDFGIWGGWGPEPTYNGVFSNNHIINYDNYAIMMDKSAYSVFENNIVSDGRLGIAVDNSFNITVRNNQVFGTQFTGLYLYNSPLSTVSGNTVVGSGQDGILIENSGLTMVNNNHAINNVWSGISLTGSSYSVVLENTVTGNHGNGIGVLSSDESYVVINTVTGNGLGIGLYNSRNNNVTDNNVTGNNAGINVVDYTNNVARNIVNNNREYGISLISNDNSIDTSHVLQNLVTFNGFGIEMVGDDNNIQTGLLEDNWVLSNDYMLRIQGNTNTHNGSTIFGNENGLIVVGNNNHLSNITAVYNALTGITINGAGNSLNGSLILNNTNGVIVTGLGNNISDNYVLNNTGTGIYVSGTNPVTGNIITQNNGSALVLRTDNNNMNLTQVAFNILMNNGQGVTILGDGNNINSLLFLLNAILNNNYELTIQGNNNQLHNTSITGNQNGIQINGNQNSLNNVTIHDNNQTGLIVNGNENQVNGSGITSNQDGISINGTRNNLTENNVQNNNHTGVNITGDRNNLTQNNITGNRDGVVVNGTNNTLHYNRISQNTANNLRNDCNGTVDARYNWWGRNTPTRVTGPSIDTNNYVVATQVVEGVGNGVINTGQLYNVFIRLADSQENALEMSIPSFLIYFYLDGGDVYPCTAIITNNTAQTQIQVFAPGSYTLRTVLDEETLITNLRTPVNAQTFTPIKRTTTTDTGVSRYYCGPESLNILLGFLGFNTSVDELARLAGTTSQGTTFLGMIQAAGHFGVTLNGVQLDAGLLKGGDIVLLNVDGYYHYGFIIQRIGDLIVLQDPAYGIRILTLNEFNKIYTGYALTTKDGIGFPLSDDQLNSFTGGNANLGATLFETLLAMAGVLTASASVAASSWWFPPLAAAIFVGGLIFFGGNWALDRFAPDLIPRKGTGWKGLAIDFFNVMSPIIQLNQEGIPKSRYDLTKEWINFSMFDNGVKQIFGDLGKVPDDDRDLVERLIEGVKDAPWYYKVGAGVISLIVGIPYMVPVLYSIVGFGGKLIDSVLSISNKISDTWKRITDYKPTQIPTMSTMNNTNATPLMAINTLGIVNSISKGINGIGEWLVNAQKNFAPTLEYLKNDFILAAVQDIPGAKKIATVAQSSYQTLKTGYEKVKNAWGSFSNGVKQEIASLTSNPVDYISNKFNQGVSWAKNEIYKASKIIYKGLSWAGAKIQSGINWVGSQVKSGINWVANKVQSGINWVGNNVQSGWNWLWGH
jgi:parallel beta-helix repeat protein